MLTIHDIKKLIGGYSVSTIWRWYHEGFLPKSVALDGKTMLWDRNEIIQFCRQKRFINAYSV